MRHGFIDPELPIIAIWSTRSNSMVQIFGRLPLWDSALNHYHFLALGLRIPKSTVKILVESDGFKTLATQILIFLFSISLVGSASRKKRLSIPMPIDQFPGVRVILLREDISTFRKFFNQVPSPNKSNWEFLYESIRIFLIPARFLETIVNPPRGKASPVFDFNKEISIALFTCRELLINGGKVIQHRIKEILVEMIREDEAFLNYIIRHNLVDILEIIKNKEEDDEINIVNILESIPIGFRQELIIIGLIHRAFKGAWEKHGHPGLFQDHPHDVFRKYLYGKHRDWITTHAKLCKEKFPDLYQSILDTAKRNYLGNLGAAFKKTYKF
jgi:hypothetical protein